MNEIKIKGSAARLALIQEAALAKSKRSVKIAAQQTKLDEILKEEERLKQLKEMAEKYKDVLEEKKKLELANTCPQRVVDLQDRYRQLKGVKEGLEKNFNDVIENMKDLGKDYADQNDVVKSLIVQRDEMDTYLDSIIEIEDLDSKLLETFQPEENPCLLSQHTLTQCIFYATRLVWVKLSESWQALSLGGLFQTKVSDDVLKTDLSKANEQYYNIQDKKRTAENDLEAIKKLDTIDFGEAKIYL